MADEVVLDRGNGTSATVHLYGSTLISWKTQGEERIFVSSKSLFDNKKAIRGGIPIVFPCFGPWEHGPQHGFARISRWKVQTPPTKNCNGDVEVAFTLEDNEQTRSMWNYKFQLTCTVVLGESTLTTKLEIENKGDCDFDFTCLLHTYIKVADISKVTVSNLQGLTYVDKVKGGQTFKEERDLVVVAENVDRVYKKTPPVHDVRNTVNEQTMVVTKKNLPDTVVWNPWAQKAAEMSDFGNDEYPNMICVEAGYISEPFKLSAKQRFQCSQELSCRM